MSSGQSDYLRNALQNHLTGVAAYTPPTQINVAYFTARGTPAQACAGTNFTEVSTSGTGYARVNIGVGVVNWNSALAGLSDNKLSVAMGAASTDWGTVTAIGLYDQSNNLLWWGDITGRNLTTGAVVSLPAGTIDLSLPVAT